MSRFFIAAAALATLATPALAAEPVTKTFVRDGVRYSYTSTQKPGYTVLEGTANGAPFHLEVHGREVTGNTDGMSVDFSVQSALSGDDLASR